MMFERNYYCCFLGALEDEDHWKMNHTEILLSLWFYLGGAPGPPFTVGWPPSTVNKQAPIQITWNIVSSVWQLGTIIQFLHTFCDLTLSHNLTELLIQFIQLSAAAKKTSAGHTGPLALDTAGVLPSFGRKKKAFIFYVVPAPWALHFERHTARWIVQVRHCHRKQHSPV